MKSCSMILVAALKLAILLLSFHESFVFGDKIKERIYRKLNSAKTMPCVTLLNATHQIGCKSKRKGNVGVVHYIQSDEDFEWLLKNGEHAPYIPLFAAEYFTDERLKQLIDADKVSGAMVVHDVHHNHNGTDPPAAGFSPEHSCPKDKSGLYKSHSKYSCSNGDKAIIWNQNGSGMAYKNYDIPIFALEDWSNITMLQNCYNKYNKPVNGTNPGYPLCAVELQSFMFAAKDTPTCMRKNEAPKFTEATFCDPLGDQNVWGTLFPMVGDLEKDDVILATAKLDSSSFFHGIAPGGDNDATGVIVLLAAAEALGRLRREGKLVPPDLSKNEKHIMFSFFQGEVWDYIGSSRMVYDMENGKFPSCRDDTCTLSRVNTSNIAYYLELNQVGFLDDGSLWAHSDPLSKKFVGNEVAKMFNMLENFGAGVQLSIKNASEESEQPLPPASFQRFLKKSLQIPGIVLSDHKTSFTNRYYNSRFDDYKALQSNNSFRATVELLTRLATTVSNSLYQLAYNKKVNITAERAVVDDLLTCFLLTANCWTFKNASTKSDAKQLAVKKEPLLRYVGTHNKQNVPHSPISKVTKRVLAYFTGLHSNEDCPDSKTENYVLLKMENDRLCVNATVYMSPALSPAFLNKDYTSTEDSTWTESRWRSTGIKLFLIADPAQEVITLVVGIVLTLISAAVTIFMYTKADKLFTPDGDVLVINDLQ